MKLNCYYIIYLPITLAFIIFIDSDALSQPGIDFWKMKGILVKHPYQNKDDSSSQKVLLELKNEKGLPLWFATDVHSNVCLSKECLPLNLWLYWNGAGGYLGFQLYNNEPLTKTDDVVFTQQDYEKLNYLLADSSSVLKRIKPEDLVISPGLKDERIDAYTGATRPSLQQYMVKDAAYTCYTLWHIVYGTIQINISNILEENANEPFLKMLFEQNESTYKSWAISFIRKNPSYNQKFIKQIIAEIKSEDENLSFQALNYFESKYLADSSVQINLVSQVNAFNGNRQYELLWKLNELPHVQDQTILILLKLFHQQEIKIPLLGYIYDLVRPVNLRNPLIEKSLKNLLHHENLYIRNITRKLLNN